MEGLHIYGKHQESSDNLDYLYAKLAEEETMSIFSNSVVKALIEVKWKTIMKRILYW